MNIGIIGLTLFSKVAFREDETATVDQQCRVFRIMIMREIDNNELSNIIDKISLSNIPIDNKIELFDQALTKAKDNRATSTSQIYSVGGGSQAVYCYSSIDVINAICDALNLMAGQRIKRKESRQIDNLIFEMKTQIEMTFNKQADEHQLKQALQAAQQLKTVVDTLNIHASTKESISSLVEDYQGRMSRIGAK